MDYQKPHADDQQPPPYYQPPSAPTEVQQPSAPTEVQQPSAPNADQQPRPGTKRPPTDEQPPPAYDQINAKRKFVGPLSASRLPNPYLQQPCIQEYPEQSDNKPVVNQPTAPSTSRWSSPYSQEVDWPTALSTSRWSSPYSQQKYVPLEEYPEQSNKPVVKQPAGDGIFSVLLGGEESNTGHVFNTYTTSPGGFSTGQQNTTPTKYPEEECLENCLICCECMGYCCYCVAFLCEILSACK